MLICVDCGQKLTLHDDRCFPTTVNTGGKIKNQVYINNIDQYTCYNEDCDMYINKFAFTEDVREKFNSLQQILKDSGLKHQYGGGRTYKRNSRFAELIDFFQIKQSYGGFFTIDVDYEEIKNEL